MKNNVLIVAFACMLCFASCKKDREEAAAPDESSLETIAVGDNFDWSATNEINFSVGTSDNRFQNLIHVIYIYDIEPAKGGKVLAKGSATLITPFNTKLSFADATKTVYVVKAAPDGSKIGKEVALTSSNINISFSSTSASQLSNRSSAEINDLLAQTTNVTVLPLCTRSTTSANIFVTLLETVCFTSSADAQLNITSIGGTIRINAPGRRITIGNLGQNGGLPVNIIVEANTTVVMGGTEVRAAANWINNGTLQFTGKLTLNGTLTNYGTLRLVDQEITALGALLNYGTLVATGITDIAGKLNNSNTATFAELRLNGTLAVINNYCKLIADNILNNSIINNYSYILARNSFKSNSGGRVNMIGFLISGAYFETKRIEKGSNEVYFIGLNATSIVKATEIDPMLVNEARFGKPIITGNISLWTTATVSNNFFFLFPAGIGNSAYIKSDECMPVSNGSATTPPVKDRDNDNVGDGDDDYPDDATRAYNNYSVNYDNGGSTLAFEDSWPVKGDYDLNDLVVTYRHIVVTNANNRVVEIKAGYKLIATGADYTNGFGVEFPIEADKVKLTTGPSGAYLEGNQTNAVLVLFDNGRRLQPYGNTVIGKVTSPAVDFNITLAITDGPEIKNFGTVVYNPFIWNATNGFGRGYETHLYGKSPTSLANNELFETKDDFSKSNNIYYSTKEKLPWVIEIPISNFGYPIEGAKIDRAYTNFANWATTSGASSNDWYLRLAGGANAALIYPVK